MAKATLTGNKEVIYRNKFIDAEDISGNYTSDLLPIMRLYWVGLEFIWTTADVNGTISIDVSVSGDNWERVGPLIAVSGSSSFKIGRVDTQGWEYIRITFTNSSGSTGTLDAYWSAQR